MGLKGFIQGVPVFEVPTDVVSETDH